MHLEQIRLSNFRCFFQKETIVDLEEDLTCFVGNNGSGKTALIMALKRLFGSTREDRTITRDDFYLPQTQPLSRSSPNIFLLALRLHTLFHPIMPLSVFLL